MTVISRRVVIKETEDDEETTVELTIGTLNISYCDREESDFIEFPNMNQNKLNKFISQLMRSKEALYG